MFIEMISLWYTDFTRSFAVGWDTFSMVISRFLYLCYLISLKNIPIQISGLGDSPHKWDHCTSIMFFCKVQSLWFPWQSMVTMGTCGGGISMSRYHMAPLHYNRNFSVVHYWGTRLFLWSPICWFFEHMETWAKWHLQTFPNVFSQKKKNLIESFYEVCSLKVQLTMKSVWNQAWLGTKQVTGY